ncbi:TonB-dependent receptor plug domain-containing protein [Membranihabitans marinus]|uniref:TonB-dependent receptor plug domain-containing protein n=1 Tax=Membranihabitans marinus TaxID=1227546 RepID=UPI001F3D46B4|nr:TonB-dependent receptor plug domain-containing protein [Membranihabitans marinus]
MNFLSIIIKDIRRLLSHIIISICSISSIFSQSIDTAVTIPEINISTGQPLAHQYDSIDIDHRIYQQPSIAGYLRNKYNIYFKNYGPGASSTISMNGGKAGEVAIVWNGIVLQNPMLGVNDYSMISLSDLSKIQIIDMASNNIYGAGAISGTIALNTDTEIDPTMPHSFTLGYTSYQQGMAHLNLGFKHKNWTQRFQISGLQSKNNFTYTNNENEKQKLEHAAHQVYNLQYDAKYRKSNREWKLALWARDQFRQIPAPINSKESKAEQSDRFVRASLQYNHVSNRHVSNIKSFMGIQHQNYNDEAIILDAHHTFYNPQLRLDNQWYLNNEFTFKYGGIIQSFQAKSDNYSEVHQQTSTSIYSQIIYNPLRLPITVSGLLKPEWATSFDMDLVSEIKVEIRPKDLGSWTIYGGRNIVFPTFNDRFWVPGGNIDLIPESNFTYGLRHHHSIGSHWSYKLEWFNRHADNWIQWLPGDGYWSPQNFNKARNYGINASLTWSNHFTTIQTRYQWARTFLIDHPQAYKQTIYNPEHLINLHGRQTITENISFLLDIEYTSRRYVLSDHSDDLHPYFLLHPSITFKSSNKQWQLDATIYNLLNHSYQGIKNRPMPGITFEINTKYNFIL